MNPRKFFAELKRRNVYKVAVAYGALSWLLIQIATRVFPFFEIPNWAIRLVIMLLVIGFPIALVIAWAFELTPEGLKRTEFADELPEKIGAKSRLDLCRNHAGAISVGDAVGGFALTVRLPFHGACQHWGPGPGLTEKQLSGNMAK